MKAHARSAGRSISRRWAIGLAIGVASCGGRVQEVESGELDAAVPRIDAPAATTDSGRDTEGRDSVTGDASVDGGGGRCHLSDGTSLCGAISNRCGDCLEGGSCSYFRNAAGEPSISVFGLCGGRYAMKTVLPQMRVCSVCSEDGLVCVNYAGNLWCARELLCRELEDQGFPNSCWYADKTRWSREAPIADLPSVPCPAGAIGFCGGGCGGCSPDLSCAGRSPRHPLGVCARPLTPSLESTNITNRCSRKKPTCLSGEQCLIFETGFDGDQALADEYGACVGLASCRAAVKVLPGGAFCIDSAGRDVPP